MNECGFSWLIGQVATRLRNSSRKETKLSNPINPQVLEALRDTSEIPKLLVLKWILRSSRTTIITWREGIVRRRIVRPTVITWCERIISWWIISATIIARCKRVVSRRFIAAKRIVRRDGRRIRHRLSSGGHRLIWHRLIGIVHFIFCYSQRGFIDV